MERVLLRIAVSIIVGCSLSAEAKPSPTSDHLEPQSFAAEPQYRQLLLSKLAVTPFDYGRVLILPFEGGEDCQSVYVKSNEGRRAYYITRTSSEKNLWHLTDGGRHPELARSVKVRRVDAELPEQTAQLLKQVWLKILEGPNGPKPTPRPDPHVLPQLHPMYIEFSIPRPGNPPLIGSLNLSAGYPGEKTQQFAEIAEATYRYCTSEQAKRGAIAKRINKDAQRLLDLFKQ